MSLPETALTRLSDAKTEVGVSGSGDDAYIEALIESVSEDLRKRCGREFYWNTDYQERVRATGEFRLVVKDHVPIDTINSIKFDDGDNTDTINSGDYRIEDANLGWIEKINDVWADTQSFRTEIERIPDGPYRIDYKVDYDGGFRTPVQDDNGITAGTALPKDIKIAVEKQVALLYANQGIPANVESEKVGNASISYSSEMDQTNPFFDTVARRYSLTQVL